MVKKISEVPEGIKILAFLFFAGALLLIMVGGFTFSFIDGLNNLDPAALVTANLDQLGSWPILVGIVLIVFGIFSYFMGRDLLKARSWAKLVVAIVSILGVLSAILNLSGSMYASGVFGLIVNGTIAWYILSNKEVKAFFVK